MFNNDFIISFFFVLLKVIICRASNLLKLIYMHIFFIFFLLRITLFLGSKIKIKKDNKIKNTNQGFNFGLGKTYSECVALDVRCCS